MRPVGAELFHADRQTNMTKLIVTFRNTANALKKKKTTPNIFSLTKTIILYQIRGTFATKHLKLGTVL